MSVKIRLPFVPYEDKGLECLDPSLTHQSFADECNYNNVLAKWENSGLITHINPNSPVYADVSDLGDYQSALELIRSAQSSFDALPSSVRDRFNNDPAKLLEFVQDPKNEAEALRLGLTLPTPSGVAAVSSKDITADTPEAGGTPA